MSVPVQLTDGRRKVMFVNIIITCIATSLLMTALNTALTPISEDMGFSITTAQWITSGYTLTMGIVMPLTAFIIRRFKTKRLYLIGIAIFMCGLVIALTSVNFPMLMCGRVCQACGNGILVSMAQVVILTIFPAEKKGRMMGWYGLAVSAAPVIAPTLGGVLVDTISWRAIFALDLVIMCISFIMAIFAFDNVLETAMKKFDFKSFVLSVVTFGGITLGIGNLASSGVTDIVGWLSLAIGLVVGIFFIRKQLHMDDPFLNVGILKVKEYSTCLIGSMMLYFVLMGSSILMPLYVQQVMGYSATISGLVTLPGSLAMAIVNPFAGRIYDKIGIKKLFIFGAACMIVSNVGMFFITTSMPLSVGAVFNAFRCVAIGLLLMPLITWGTSCVNPKSVADATALLSSLRSIAGAIGTAVFVGIMTMVAANSVDKFGDNAKMHGLNMAFICMSVVSIILFFMGIFLVKDKKAKTP